ncbi:MAG: tRNA-dihydrouridine synthase, partial [Deltaproteobacteria bacterium]|nr:tRNA-dihydrouridine synthase [Deltaproteobacteria bacterium]
RNPELVSTACREFPGRIIVGIDARDGQVAVEGWTEDTDLSVVELAKRYEEKGVSAVIYTDIHRDGMSMGPNVEGTRRLAEKISVPVIASGGISGIKDIEKILELSKYGVIGMITGRALYEGKLSLREALECVKKKRS